MTGFVLTAHCTRADCEWTAEGPGSDRAAERHTKATGHATISSMRARDAA